MRLLNGVPFTGIAFWLDANGLTICESQFREGLRWGLTWERCSNGAMYVARSYLEGLAHGIHREWYESGWLKEEVRFEYGVRLEWQSWAPTGQLQESGKLTLDSWQHSELERLRSLFESGGHLPLK
jgi:antitoxin component YwqK of YwqJK toxin-antitoxin module